MVRKCLPIGTTPRPHRPAHSTCHDDTTCAADPSHADADAEADAEDAFARARSRIGARRCARARRALERRAGEDVFYEGVQRVDDTHGNDADDRGSGYVDVRDGALATRCVRDRAVPMERHAARRNASRFSKGD